jgi:hypothetical protein
MNLVVSYESASVRLSTVAAGMFELDEPHTVPLIDSRSVTIRRALVNNDKRGVVVAVIDPLVAVNVTL